MIVNDSKIDVKASGSFESTEFRIDPKYRNKVLWMLINQYRHKVRTPVQEIISNARDAQRENGNPDRPIKIQLPTRLESTFIVRDYGVGMDEDRIKTIFTSFGASTKSSSNEQTGGFGIGAKSPLAYTDSFNIKTYINGKYWFYVVAKTSNDGIGLTLLDSGDTTEENGTEVQIPVSPSDVRTFVSSACRCTMFWEVQPIFNLPKEELFVVNNDNVLEISDKIKVYKKPNLGNLFDANIVLAVDGIPYEVDSHTIQNNQKMREFKALFNYGTNVVIKINTGDIDLLQTRESIDETDRTTRELTKIAFKAYTQAKIYMNSHLSETCLIERYKQYKQLYSAFHNIPAIDYSIFKLRMAGIELPKGLQVYWYDYKGRSRGFVKNAQKHFKTHDKTIPLDQLNNLYWDNLHDESSNQKARRLRYKLETLKNASNNSNVSVMVIDKGNASSFEYIRTCRMLKAEKLSTLPVPPKSVTVSKSSSSNGTRKLDQGKIMLNLLEYNSYENRIKRNAQEKELSTIKDKFIYDDYSNYDNRLLEKGWHKLISDLGYKVALISKKYHKNVEASDKFTSANVFFSKFKVNEDIKNAYIAHKVRWSYSSNNGDICGILKSNNCKDQILFIMSNLLNNKEDGSNYYYNVESYPKIVLDKLNKDKKILDRIKRLDKLKQSFSERLEKKYPMIKYISDRTFRYNTNQIKVDIIDYINSTYRSRQCK